ncbi:hypothetical protein PG995_010795 [Apiospora arundinis]
MTPEPAAVLQGISTAAALIFILTLPIRLWMVRNSTRGVRGIPSWKGRFKLALALWLSAALFLYRAEATALEIQYEARYWLSHFASTLAALGLSLLLFLEQQWCYRISHQATLYLLVSILCDIVYLAIQFYAAERTNLSRPVLIRFCAQLTLFVLEYRTQRRPILGARGKVPHSQKFHGLFSRLLFLWVNPILLQGYRNVLRQTDMPPLDEEMLPGHTRKAMIKSWSEREVVRPETSKSLPLAIMLCLKKPFLDAVLPRFLLIIFRYSQPALISQSIKYVSASPAAPGGDYGYWIIISAVTIYTGLGLSTAAYQNRLNRLKLMTRSALVGLIHDHTMKLASVAYDNGAATTLMSTDADSLDGIGEMVHEIWAQIAEVLIGMWLLFGQVGWIWPLPLVLIYLSSHVSRFVAKHLQPSQKAWNSATQDRIAATSSVLKTMKVIKMLGFQGHLSSRIQKLREFELWTAAKLRWVMIYYNASANALGIFSPAITLIVFAIILSVNDHSLDMETAFTTTAILGMVTHPANMVMTFVPRVMAALSGFERIQAFLLREPLHANRGALPKAALHKLAWNPATGQAVTSSPAIRISQVQIGQTRTVLENLNIDVATGSLTILSGPTGSGKSTLLRVILGEVISAQGLVSLSTRRIAYCAQRPWLPNGTIKEVVYSDTNTHGASDQDYAKWYSEVIDTCCLTHDINSLTDGDQTQIGSRGLNLSGGQRQRVALARALFAKYDLILLDDTFSGLDRETEQTLFRNLLGPSGLLRRLRTTVVLASNSAQYFPIADHIVVLGNGGVVKQGNWRMLNLNAAPISKLSSGHTGDESMVLSADYENLSHQLRANAETELDLARQTGDTALYGYYLRFIDLMTLLFLVGDTAIYAFFVTIPQYWLQLWTESDGESTAYYVSIYFFLSSVSWASTSAQLWSVLTRLAPQSGLRAHQRLLDIISRAPLSFFSTTDNGSILNRFSQDIQLIDKHLPTALQTIFLELIRSSEVCKLIMQVGLLCMAEKWLTAFFPVCMLLVYSVQKVYLRTSRQLRYLELESRAQVFSSFLESVEGLETIRAFSWSTTVIRKNVLSVENSQRPEFLLLCLQRWLNIVLDLLAAGVATAAITIAVVFRGHVSGAQIGIALNIMLVANTTLLKLVENWTVLEMSLGAISRLKMLEQTTPIEGKANWSKNPPQKWPARGQVEFKDITAAYHSECVAIKNLSLKVTAGQRLIVCGRTGSGKSTLFLALLRLLELRSGTIEVDGIDIKHVRLDVLRQRCFIAVSQDPLLLPEETLRFNLDPDNVASDEALIIALTKSGLWSHFFEGEKKRVEGGIVAPGFGEHLILDQKVSVFQELSVGQCQLFSICRALVKSGVLRASGVTPVVLLDEVTSSLDVDMESTVFRVIDEEFTGKGHTTIIVTHRLGTLYTKVGRDAVAFMADGRLQELRSDLSPRLD